MKKHGQVGGTIPVVCVRSFTLTCHHYGHSQNDTLLT